MPTLDLTEVLLAAEFQDTFTLTSGTRTINSNGVAIDDPTTVSTEVGVIIPDASSLNRQPDGSRVSSAIDIYTQVMLTEGYTIREAQSQNADIITWNGRDYVVEDVTDFSNFGQGFVHANAVLINLSSSTESQGDAGNG